MVRTYTATVERGEVHVRGLDLPDGSTVTVTIDEGVWELSDEEKAGLDEAEAEIARGEWTSGEEVIRRLRAGEPVFREGERQSEAPARPRKRVVGPKPPVRKATIRHRRR